MDGKVVATCRIMPTEKKAKLGRMAVLKEYRNQKIASSLIQYVESQRNDIGFQTLQLGAQLQAIPFYESCGFHCYGDIFLDANIEHRMMEKHYE